MVKAPSAAPSEEKQAQVDLQRPDVLYLASEIVHLWDLNIKGETFSIETIIHCKWPVDPQHADAVMKESGGDVNEHWEPEWVPRYKIHNTTAELTSAEHEWEAHRDEQGVVWISGKTWLSVSISEEYELHPFPFDMQHLEVEIEVPNVHLIEPMTIKPVDSRAWGHHLKRPVLCHLEGVQHLPDFKLSSQVPCSYKYIGGSEKEASVLVIVMVYDRQYNYHLYNSYGVLAGIGTVSLANWALPVTELGSRLSLDITLLLVSVAFKQVLGNELPPVSYLTILDHYSLAIIGFVFLATWLHGMVGLAELEGFELEVCEAIDFWLVTLYASSFFLYHLWHAAYVRTQLFFNDVMTDPTEIGLHGFAPAQLGQVNAEGKYEKFDSHVNSVFGQYAERPSRAASHEVWPVLRLLIEGMLAGHTSHEACREEYHRRHLAGQGGFARLDEEGHDANEIEKDTEAAQHAEELYEESVAAARAHAPAPAPLAA